MRARMLPAGLTVVALAAAAAAHETWLVPSTFSAKVGEIVRLDLTSGMAFPRLESPIKADRIATARYRLGGKEAIALKELEGSERSLVMRQAFPTAGSATVWLDLNPKEIALTDDEVTEYFVEIDATERVRSIWAGRKGRVAWKETYTKHAKTFVAVGEAKADRSWSAAVGQALELVPASDPMAVAVGGEFTVTLLVGGKALAGSAVGLQVEGVKPHVFRTTDAEGKATFPMAKDGRAMLYAVRLLPAPDGLTWTSDFCTMTFEIHRPARE